MINLAQCNVSEKIKLKQNCKSHYIIHKTILQFIKVIIIAWLLDKIGYNYKLFFFVTHFLILRLPAIYEESIDDQGNDNARIYLKICQ